MLVIAEAAARRAGAIQRERYRTGLTVRQKGALDLVTDVDVACEEAIREVLRRRAPGTAVLGEEGGLEGDGADRWVVDPLDGTTNYAHGFPVFCVSIAWEAGGRVRAGVVYDPLRDELFGAEEGRGSLLNGAPIRVTRTGTLEDALLATGFPYDRRTNPRNNLDAFARLTLATQGVRRGGAAALDLAYVAAGRLDGFWEPGLKPWDLAAGILLVVEAGGRVTGYAGDPFTLRDSDVVASNGPLHAPLLENVRASEARGDSG
ncbi:MAG: inositol monophosphatase [Deltaproteobacteria bacterium]|nr:inositol monophosphatase [Deltaproteobacteria bacterium]